VGEPKEKLQVPPLRFAPVGMTKWSVALHLGSSGGGWTEPYPVSRPTRPLCRELGRTGKVVLLAAQVAVIFHTALEKLVTAIVELLRIGTQFADLLL